MGTRCQVVVISDVASNRDCVNLCHHFDGYPAHMIPLIQDAFRSWTNTESGPAKYRSENVVSFIVASDPSGYSFNHEGSTSGRFHLYCDIDYLYVVKACSNGNWNIEVFTPCDGFWENPRLWNMKKDFNYSKVLTSADSKA